MPHELVDETAAVLLVLDAHDPDGCRSWLAEFAQAGGQAVRVRAQKDRYVPSVFVHSQSLELSDITRAG